MQYRMIITYGERVGSHAKGQRSEDDWEARQDQKRHVSHSYNGEENHRSFAECHFAL